jgi:hypothetical protein
VNHYRAFRDLLEEKGLEYSFNTDTEMYDIYKDRPWEWGHGIYPAQDFLVSVSAQMARRNVKGARATIETAMDLIQCFGS